MVAVSDAWAPSFESFLVFFPFNPFSLYIDAPFIKSGNTKKVFLSEYEDGAVAPLFLPDQRVFFLFFGSLEAIDALSPFQDF